MEFCKDFIVVLTQYQDKIIRPSYFGGATDYYKQFGTNLHYYDVNSLYPFAMKNLMPYKLLSVNKIDESLTSWLNIFGFIDVEIYCSEDVKIPLIPAKYNNKTIFPTGNWIGT